MVIVAEGWVGGQSESEGLVVLFRRRASAAVGRTRFRRRVRSRLVAAGPSLISPSSGSAGLRERAPRRTGSLEDRGRHPVRPCERESFGQGTHHAVCSCPEHPIIRMFGDGNGRQRPVAVAGPQRWPSVTWPRSGWPRPGWPRFSAWPLMATPSGRWPQTMWPWPSTPWPSGAWPRHNKNVATANRVATAARERGHAATAVMLCDRRGLRESRLWRFGKCGAAGVSSREFVVQ